MVFGIGMLVPEFTVILHIRLHESLLPGHDSMERGVSSILWWWWWKQQEQQYSSSRMYRFVGMSVEESNATVWWNVSENDIQSDIIIIIIIIIHLLPIASLRRRNLFGCSRVWYSTIFIISIDHTSFITIHFTITTPSSTTTTTNGGILSIIEQGITGILYDLWRRRIRITTTTTTTNAQSSTYTYKTWWNNHYCDFVDDWTTDRHITEFIVVLVRHIDSIISATILEYQEYISTSTILYTLSNFFQYEPWRRRRHNNNISFAKCWSVWHTSTGSTISSNMVSIIRSKCTYHTRWIATTFRTFVKIIQYQWSPWPIYYE